MTVRRERESLGRAFARFWCAQSVSEFGDRITELALPATAVYLLHGSTLQVALITALAQTPNLLALPLGAWADGRASKRALMVAADLIRAVLLLTLPIAALVGSVTLAHLYVLALLTGAAGVLFNVGYPSFFARLVPRTGYVRANSRLSASRSASFVGGPALAGGLIQLLTAPVAVLADAASFVFSAVLVGTLPPDERAGARPAMTERAMTGRRMTESMREGVRQVFGSPILRADLLAATTINFFSMAAAGLIVVFAGRDLALPAGAVGLALGIGAAGGLVGAMAAPAFIARAGIGRTVMAGAVVFPVSIAIVAAASGAPWQRMVILAAAEFCSGVGVMLFDIPLNSLATTIIPDELRSRVSGVFGTINYGVRAAGALAGGLLASAAGIRTTLVIAAAGGILSVLWLAVSPIRTISDIAEVTPAGATDPEHHPEDSPTGCSQPPAGLARDGSPPARAAG